jgi:hypothetical protein
VPSASLRSYFPFYSIAHDPGAPPQRPHIGASELEVAAELTAKTLRLRAVCVDPHFGHFTGSSAAFIDRTSCSNFSPHWRHAYS